MLAHGYWDGATGDAPARPGDRQPVGYRDTGRAAGSRYAAVVRYADHLRAAGVAHDDALDQALRRWGR
jgi:hypothetical protein